MKFRQYQGLTLFEVLIAIVLMGIFMAAVQETIITGLRTVNASDEREDIRQQLANALEQLTREASPASNVDNADDQRLQFDADLDGNGTTENNINYQVTSGDLQRTYDAVTVTLVRDLSSLDFNYTNASGSAMTTPVGNQPDRDTIRVVEMTLSAARDGESISLDNAVYMRNQ
jgi:prepilin-type N-terminal cleavage/methylation domain-containing protein